MRKSFFRLAIQSWSVMRCNCAKAKPPTRARKTVFVQRGDEHVHRIDSVHFCRDRCDYGD